MNEIHCRNRDDLLAAIEGIAELTYEAARENPAVIYAGGATYTFKAGLQQSKVRGILRNIRRMPKHIFTTKEPNAQVNATLVQSAIDVRVMPPEVRLSLRLQDREGFRQ
jgi:hypothetical protein